MAVLANIYGQAGKKKYVKAYEMHLNFIYIDKKH